MSNLFDIFIDPIKEYFLFYYGSKENYLDSLNGIQHPFDEYVRLLNNLSGQDLTIRKLASNIGFLLSVDREYDILYELLIRMRYYINELEILPYGDLNKQSTDQIMKMSLDEFKKIIEEYTIRPVNAIYEDRLYIIPKINMEITDYSDMW